MTNLSTKIQAQKNTGGVIALLQDYPWVGRQTPEGHHRHWEPTNWKGEAFPEKHDWIQSANYRPGYVLASHCVYFSWGTFVRDASKDMHRGEKTYIDAMYYFEPIGIHQQPSEKQRDMTFGAIGSHAQYPRCHRTVYEQHKRRR
eukprot:10153346-Karenia_brevis.AAC.1